MSSAAKSPEVSKARAKTQRAKTQRAKTQRARPQLATTVAPETLAALSRLSGERVRGKHSALGTVIDALVWDAIELRLELLASLGLPKPSLALPGDKALFASLTREARALAKMSHDARSRRAAELQSAHEARVACGAWSGLDEFVARFVAQRPSGQQLLTRA
jgi:hypothetical protein